MHKRIRTFSVEHNHDGWRLDCYLTEKVGRLSRSKVRRILGGISIDRGGVGGVRIKAGTRLRYGDVVSLEESLPMDDPECPLWTLVDELDFSPPLLSLGKPAGLLVHPTAKVERHTVVGYLKEFCAHLGRVEPVHRLDRETSGVLLAAIGVDAIRDYQKMFASGAIDKTYHAIVDDPRHQHVVGGKFMVDTPLGFEEGSRLRVKIGRGSWEARTYGVCIGRQGDRAYLEVHIDGGRQHQIRVHLAMLQTPICGDVLYGLGEDAYIRALGEEREAPRMRHALHCSQLSFERAGRRESFSSPLPRDMEGLRYCFEGAGQFE